MLHRLETIKLGRFLTHCAQAKSFELTHLVTIYNHSIKKIQMLFFFCGRSCSCWGCFFPRILLFSFILCTAGKHQETQPAPFPSRHLICETGLCNDTRQRGEGGTEGEDGGDKDSRPGPDLSLLAHRWSPSDSDGSRAHTLRHDTHPSLHYL